MTMLDASGWFLSEPNEEGNEHRRKFRRVVVWQIQEDGKVVGLISYPRGPRATHTAPNLKVPDEDRAAYYVHWDDMTADEREQYRASLA